MNNPFGRLPELYEHHIIEAGKQPQLFVLLSFLATFLVARLVAHTIRTRRGIRFVTNLKAGQTHIHHLVPGIILLLVSGYLGVAVDRSRLEIVAVLFGIGAALTLDEFALWLHLRDVYWEREGRRSIDAVLITAAILGIFVIGGEFFLHVAQDLLTELPP